MCRLCQHGLYANAGDQRRVQFKACKVKDAQDGGLSYTLALLLNLNQPPHPVFFSKDLFPAGMNELVVQYTCASIQQIRSRYLRSETRGLDLRSMLRRS